ncbi:hypothetical protein [Hydrogenibacillus sp. N12]|uniref:hypothetical protein n=1 Tax=Hydrogenibacillus sp. N12 TaxID=2866627 RepID=UPI001C7CBB36|nr:hypothetical protein [Hydrogenibacillus sp. N12]QZA34343.1 hypothetical protein K2M58_03700 [Hydrogenibacillus sp. N12]
MLVDIDKIGIGDRIRKVFGDIEELARDIEQNGLITGLNAAGAQVKFIALPATGTRPVVGAMIARFTQSLSSVHLALTHLRYTSRVRYHV